MAQGKLYIVSTPIGNLEGYERPGGADPGGSRLHCSRRSRHTAQLLNSLGIRNRLISFTNIPGGNGQKELVEMLLEGRISLW